MSFTQWNPVCCGSWCDRWVLSSKCDHVVMKMSYIREGLSIIFREDLGPGKNHGALGCESVVMLKNTRCVLPSIENDR